MTDTPAPRRRRWIRWTVLAVLGILLLCIGWVVVRGLMAVNDLQSVKSAASHMRADISAQNIDHTKRDARELASHAASAHSLTSDPVWRAFEVIPLLGPNLSATREMATIADDIASDAVDPLLEASAKIDLKSLGLKNGAIDLQPFRQVQAPLATASKAMTRAVADAERIDAGALLPPLADAVAQLRGAIGEAATATATLHGAAELIPTMLGGNGPRTYIFAMLNNAELRSDGGIVGALAEIRADNGALSIVRNASTADFPALTKALPVSASTDALFGDGPGRYIQNITSIPDFTEAGPLLATRWEGRFGGKVDGVVAIDTVVAQHLLKATGPQQVGPFRLDADNVLPTLLSEVYSKVQNPLMQDAVFAEVAAKLFSAATHTANPRAMIAAMADASQENRIHLWSAHAGEQRILAASTLGGALPRDSAKQKHVGVLLNDTTGGKMDYYARASIDVATGVCHGDATTRVSVTWTSTAPANAAATLTDYVTGGGHYGVKPGSIGTRIAVYGPAGATPTRVRLGGVEKPVQTADLDGRIAVQQEVTLTPGASATITVDYIGAGAGIRSTAVTHTPMATQPKITSTKLACTS